MQTTGTCCHTAGTTRGLHVIAGHASASDFIEGFVNCVSRMPMPKGHLAKNTFAVLEGVAANLLVE